jgi:HD-GYP domain-containing protein (c-di-GMP phosphodiesterase class II)
LKAHELTYFGIKGNPITRKTSDTNITNKSQYTHLSTSSKNVVSSSHKLSISNNSSNNLSDKRNAVTNNVPTTSSSTKVTINHQKPDLIMHHHQKTEKSSTPELTTSEKKSMLETLDSCIDETKNLEPIYENLYQNSKYERKLDLARDKKILDELARAADEIMNVSCNFLL